MKRIEKLNNLFFTYMCGQDPHDAEAETAGTRCQHHPLGAQRMHALARTCPVSSRPPSRPHRTHSALLTAPWLADSPADGAVSKGDRPVSQEEAGSGKKRRGKR
eukprot:scaffold2423_cov113-Isochrysis_galbana.AAC.14